MKITSFDNNSYKINRDTLQFNLFNLFQKNTVNNQNLLASGNIQIYIVPREFEMRLDRISNYLYDSPDYVEELMIINDIINPYSVKEGQYIYFCDISLFPMLYTQDEMLDDKELQRLALINASQPNRDKTNSESNQNLPTNIMQSNTQQVRINKDNSVQIINKFN